MLGLMACLSSILPYASLIEGSWRGIIKSKTRLTADAKQLHMRDYVGISALGRTVVWIRTDSANP
ncbi:DUF2147 domain-containing protein [Acinetobacter gyllenbergii]|uniref:DUF2147 domain-containing protein n=1 Tax=Acinetobacter gyllenbergii TaxID=134534 RepID=UPI0021D2512E|nr:DUF2147 domain-containing protein [Acinetobacter gyllenbergii]